MRVRPRFARTVRVRRLRRLVGAAATFARRLRRRAPRRPAARRVRRPRALRRRRLRRAVDLPRRLRRFAGLATTAAGFFRRRLRRVGVATFARRARRRRWPSLAAVRRPRPARLVKRPFLFRLRLLRAIDELLWVWSPLRRRLAAEVLRGRRRFANFTFALPFTRVPLARPRDGLTNMMGIASPCSSLDPAAGEARWDDSRFTRTATQTFVNPLCGDLRPRLVGYRPRNAPASPAKKFPTMDAPNRRT